jgi:hypothetical protein
MRRQHTLRQVNNDFLGADGILGDLRYWALPLARLCLPTRGTQIPNHEYRYEEISTRTLTRANYLSWLRAHHSVHCGVATHLLNGLPLLMG